MTVHQQVPYQMLGQLINTLGTSMRYMPPYHVFLEHFFYDLHNERWEQAMGTITTFSKFYGPKVAAAQGYHGVMLVMTREMELARRSEPAEWERCQQHVFRGGMMDLRLVKEMEGVRTKCRLEEAREYLERAMELDPTNLLFMVVLVQVLFAQDEDRLAMEWLEEMYGKDHNLVCLKMLMAAGNEDKTLELLESDPYASTTEYFEPFMREAEFSPRLLEMVAGRVELGDSLDVSNWRWLSILISRMDNRDVRRVMQGRVGWWRKSYFAPKGFRQGTEELLMYKTMCSRLLQ